METTASQVSELSEAAKARLAAWVGTIVPPGTMTRLAECGLEIEWYGRLTVPEMQRFLTEHGAESTDDLEQLWERCRELLEIDAG